VNYKKYYSNGKLGFRGNVNLRARNINFAMTYYHRGGISYTGCYHRNYPEGEDATLFGRWGRRVYKGDIKDRKLDDTRIQKLRKEHRTSGSLRYTKFHQEVESQTLEQIEEKFYRTDQPVQFSLNLTPYNVRQLFNDGLDIELWLPSIEVQHRTPKFSFYEQPFAPFFTKKLLGGENLVRCFCYAGHFLHDTENGIGKLFLETPQFDLICIFKGRWQMGVPIKGAFMLPSDGDYEHEYFRGPVGDPDFDIYAWVQKFIRKLEKTKVIRCAPGVGTPSQCDSPTFHCKIEG
jgi:hypothetical protein